MRKLAKNEKVCPICGRIFRVKPGRGKARKYCSDDCSKIGHLNKVSRKNNLGTPATNFLSLKAIKHQLYLIRNNIDKHAGKQFNSDKTKRDIMLDRLVYDEDFSIIREVVDDE